MISYPPFMTFASSSAGNLFFLGGEEGRFFASFLYEQIANVVNVTTLPETNSKRPWK